MDWSLYTIENLRTLPLWFVGTMVAMFSSLLGSFLNVCIYRIPRGESIVLPRSKCCSCDHVLGVLDLLPVLSWVFLGGKCRYCKAPVSPRYAMVELLIVCVWVGSFLYFGLYPAFPVVAVVVSLIIVLIGIFIYGKHIKGEASEASDSSGNRKGLTFLEILFTAVILAAVVGPFFNLNFTERASALRNREKILAYSLAREKLQELRCLPARKVKSDWMIYRGEGSAGSQNIFRDELFGVWAQMDDTGESFWQNMTDVLTADGHCAGEAVMPPAVFDKFKKNFKEYYGFDYEPYPDGYKIFRRTTKVDDMTNSDNPGNILKRAIVTVEIRSKVHKSGYKVRLASYIGDS